MLLMSVTAAVLHLLTSWLKEVAPLNMSFMVVTLLVSAQERAAPLLLKPVAPLNMPLMSVTAAVFHLLTSWLKEVAPLNMLLMSVTEPVPMRLDVWLNSCRAVEHGSCVTAGPMRFW